MQDEACHAESANHQRHRAPCASIIVSDFHLGAGSDSRTGIRDPYELFANDMAFVRFLDFLRQDCQAHDRRCRLILLGDLFDLPRVDLGWQPRNSDEALTAVLAKLTRIINGHPDFFAALARFGSAGFPIHVLPGNHDLPIMCPEVSAWLASTLSALAPGGSTLTLQVHPWILYEPGLFYAEHGHQYHDINHVPALLAHSLSSSWLGEQPIGAIFDHFVLRLAMLSGGATSSAATIGALVKQMVTTPWLAIRAAPISATFVAGLARRLAVSPSSYRPDHRAAYRETWISSHAPQVGIDRATLCAIDSIAARSAAQIRRRLAGAFMSLLASSISQVPRLPRQSLNNGRISPSGAASQLGSWPGGRREPAPSHRSRYLHSAAREIHAALARGGRQVPFYIFGHTHHAEIVPLAAADSPAYYVNSGSWLRGPESPHRLGSPIFPYIRIERQIGSQAIAQLMRWDDEEGRPAEVSPPADVQLPV